MHREPREIQAENSDLSWTLDAGKDTLKSTESALIKWSLNMAISSAAQRQKPSQAENAPLIPAFTPEEFVEAFIAKLVQQGFKNIVPSEPGTRRALSAVVEDLDEKISEYQSQEAKWSDLAPLIETANSLRPSELGTMENWEHQLRSAQGYLTRVPNPSYEVVEFAIPQAVAEFALQSLTATQRQLIDHLARHLR